MILICEMNSEIALIIVEVMSSGRILVEEYHKNSAYFLYM